jgi:septal ring factor EnvC (AmiA/AmiB activator)
VIAGLTVRIARGEAHRRELVDETARNQESLRQLAADLEGARADLEVLEGDRETLRAELDAARLQIASLREALKQRSAPYRPSSRAVGEGRTPAALDPRSARRPLRKGASGRGLGAFGLASKAGRAA